MATRLPIPVVMTPELKNLLLNQQIKVPASYQCQIIEIHYWGDEGGIGCKLNTPGENPVYVSLTHLRINKRHSLAKEIITYQRKRSRKLALQP